MADLSWLMMQAMALVLHAFALTGFCRVLLFRPSSRFWWLVAIASASAFAHVLFELLRLPRQHFDAERLLLEWGHAASALLCAGALLATALLAYHAAKARKGAPP